MADKRALLHIGTHKTGTTSIQRFLLNNANALARAGLYVPRSGRPFNEDGSLNPAHQEIPWGLMEHKTAPLEATLEECDRAGAPTIVISSEELHLLHDRPQVLAELRTTLQAFGYEPSLLVYVREQAGYLESIYSEIMKGVRIARFSEIVRRALAEASVEVHPLFPVPLHYSELIGHFATAFAGERLIVRPFDSRREPDYLVNDFLESAARVHGPLDREGLDTTVAHENARLTLGEIVVQLHWFATQIHGDVPDPITAVRLAGTTQHDPALGEPFRALLREERLTILNRFSEDNATVERETGITIPGSRADELAPAEDPRWARASRQRAILDSVLDVWFA